MQLWFLSSPIPIFWTNKIYATKRYIHVTEEGGKDSLFVLAKSVVPDDSTGGIVSLEVSGNNCTDGEEANDDPILLLVRTSNLHLEDMVELCRQGIAIDDDKDP